MLRLFRRADLGSRLAALQRRLEGVCPKERLGWLEFEFDRLRTEQATPVSGDRYFSSLETDVGSVSDRPLRVCILTADIVGPIRSGGIGTAFAHLARLLAADGHDVTIAFVHPKVPDPVWIDRYADEGIHLEHVAATRGAIEPAVVAYEWLKVQTDFDLVHVSEWHGLGAFAMQAKRQGLAFAETHFAVKASSPTLWNEEGNGQVLSDANQLSFAALERRSAELADTLISGSQHMLRWMKTRQYGLCEDRSFVQPNDFAPPSAAAREVFVPQEIVFFGRLEPRKGLLLFCEAVDLLTAEGVALPRLTFLGGLARRFDGGPYVSRKAIAWPCEVSVRTEMSADEVVDYLSSRDRLAVIPSLLENSSMAVMECLAHRIPFIACATGGTPELVHPEDHERVLCDSTPEDLARLIRMAVSAGAKNVRAGYDLTQSNDVWHRWHKSLPVRCGRVLTNHAATQAALLKGKSVRLHAGAEELLRSAMMNSGADIVSCFYRVRTPWNSRDVFCIGDLVVGSLKEDGIAGPCCLISSDAMEALRVDVNSPDLAGLYERALLGGFRLEVVPEVLCEVRRWR